MTNNAFAAAVTVLCTWTTTRDVHGPSVEFHFVRWAATSFTSEETMVARFLQVLHQGKN